MPGRAEDVIRRFWELQTGGRYTQLVPLFTEDCEFHDPLFGSIHGRDALAAFMAKMEEEMGGAGTTFELLEVEGDETVAWSRWIARTRTGDIQGQSLYKVRDGLISYDRDWIDTAEFARQRTQAAS